MTSGTMRIGEGPFKVRGSTYLNLRAHIDEAVPGGFPAVLGFLPSDAHRSFLSQIFLPVSWYDVFPIVDAAAAVAQAEREPFDASVRKRAVWVAKRDASGLYRLLLSALTPSLVAHRLQKVALRYFDFGRVESIDRGAHRSLAHFHGLPEPVVKWFVPMVSGYASALLEIAGAHAPRLVATSVPTETAHGTQLVRLDIELSWV